MQLNIEKAPGVFQSLSDFTRLRILRLILASDEALCLCDVSECLEEPSYKVSRHLKALREVGILKARRDGRWLYHFIPDANQNSQLLYDCIECLSDPEGALDEDLQRLENVLLKRKKGPCCATSGKRGKGQI